MIRKLVDTAKCLVKMEGSLLIPCQLIDLLSSKAILLRLWSPSEEASFLTQICPIVKLPTLIVIQWVSSFLLLHSKHSQQDQMLH